MSFAITPVADVLHFIEAKAWSGLSVVARAYPKASRLLAFPILIGTIALEGPVLPLSCIEGIIKGVIKIVKFVKSRFTGRYEQAQYNSSHFAQPYSNASLFTGPLNVIIHAVRTAVRFLLNPIKTAKEESATLAISPYYKRNYDTPEAAKFAELVVLKHFEAFKEKVTSAKTYDDLKKLTFLQDEAEKTGLNETIKANLVKLEAYFKNYNDERKSLKEAKTKLDHLRYAYESKLLDESLQFDPTAQINHGIV